MSLLQPFKGIRPNPDLVTKVVSPPYDVLNSMEARELTKGNPLSFLHVVKAEIDFPPDIDAHSREVYEKGFENLNRLQSDGTLIHDSTPCFYIYELKMGTHVQKGIMTGVSVSEYEKDLIKKHELTRPDKEEDRTNHVDILNANTGPVMLTYKASKEIDEYIEKLCSASNPVYDFIADDRIGHKLWVISSEDEVETIKKLFNGVDALYVADGHHRSAAGTNVCHRRKSKNSSHDGTEAYNYFLGVVFPDNQLQIMGYYRAVKDLAGLTTEAFIGKISELFEVAETEYPLPAEPKHFTMYLDGKWYSLAARDGTFPVDDPVLSLDVSVLQKNLLEPILGITDPRTDKRVDFIGGIRGTGELEKRCREDMRVAFALYPTGVAQLMTIADSGEIMPPKSTWFEPKLRSGMVIRSLE